MLRIRRIGERRVSLPGAGRYLSSRQRSIKLDRHERLIKGFLFHPLRLIPGSRIAWSPFVPGPRHTRWAALSRLRWHPREVRKPVSPLTFPAEASPPRRTTRRRQKNSRTDFHALPEIGLVAAFSRRAVVLARQCLATRLVSGIAVGSQVHQTREAARGEAASRPRDRVLPESRGLSARPEPLPAASERATCRAGVPPPRRFAGCD